MKAYIFAFLLIAVSAKTQYAYLVSDSPLSFESGTQMTFTLAEADATTTTTTATVAGNVTNCNTTSDCSTGYCCSVASTNITSADLTTSTVSSTVCVNAS